MKHLFIYFWNTLSNPAISIDYRSTERLLPPQALQQKNPPPPVAPKRDSSERSSTKNSRERSVPLKSPQPPESTKTSNTNEDQELSANEEFSDIGESDEELLNQGNEEQASIEPASEPPETMHDGNETSEGEDVENNEEAKESDLLEGISEEELDVSDEEREEKVKIADALRVDWSQLITPKDVKQDKTAPGSFRQRWTPGAIFSRIGLPRSLLQSGLYDKIIRDLNETGDKLEILHPVALVHAYRKRKQDEEAENKTHYKRPAFSALTETQWRRQISGLPPLKRPIVMDIYSWNFDQVETLIFCQTYIYCL